MYDVAVSGIGKHLKKWLKNQFSESSSLDAKFNNVFTHEKALLE